MINDAVVLNGGLRQSLATVRSLGRRGLRVAAVAAATGSRQKVPAFSSRWCGMGLEFPAPEGSLEYLALLERWLAEVGARVVIPAHDGTIALLRAHRSRIERSSRIAMAADDALAIAVNKERTLAVAAQVGLRAPREALVRSLGDVSDALAHIGLPAVVKPVESWVSRSGADGHWVGPRLVVTREEATQAVEAVTRFESAILLQQYLPGRREAVSFLYVAGQMHARFAQWASRTRPPLGGESVLRQSIAVPADIGPGAEALIREIDLEGYSEVEFRRDAAGTPFLMEINPRLSASVEVAIRAGVDFPHLLYCWAAGEPIPTVAGYRPGNWMRHLGGDVDAVLLSLDQQGRPGIASRPRLIREFTLSFFRPAGYDYFWWSDPAPAVVAIGRFLKEQVWSRLASRLRRMFS